MVYVWSINIRKKIFWEIFLNPNCFFFSSSLFPTPVFHVSFLYHFLYKFLCLLLVCGQFVSYVLHMLTVPFNLVQFYLYLLTGAPVSSLVANLSFTKVQKIWASHAAVFCQNAFSHLIVSVSYQFVCLLSACFCGWQSTHNQARLVQFLPTRANFLSHQQLHNVFHRRPLSSHFAFCPAFKHIKERNSHCEKGPDKAKVVAKRGHELTPTDETFWAKNFGKCKKRGKNVGAGSLSSIDPHLLAIEASFSSRE